MAATAPGGMGTVLTVVPSRPPFAARPIDRVTRRGITLLVVVSSGMETQFHNFTRRVRSMPSPEGAVGRSRQSGVPLCADSVAKERSLRRDMTRP